MDATRSHAGSLGSAMKQLLARLDTVRPTVTNEHLQEIFEALTGPLAFDDVRSFVRFDAERYTRTVIVRTKDVEVVLSGWLPGQGTPFHTHGGSACVLRVVRGTATEMVLGRPDRELVPGDVVIEGRGSAHRIVNTTDDPLLMLHVYSPPLTAPTVSRARPTRNVVIVGGGFAGAAVAYHVLRRAGADTHVHLVERGASVGRGIAYGVESEHFRLNVPAGKMSLDPDLPEDFVRFTGADPEAFLGRGSYGDYVNARLADAASSSAASFFVHRDEVVGVEEKLVSLKSGRALLADDVVLATGLRPHGVTAGPGVVDAWNETALASLPLHGRLLLVGSGLSALDVLAFLEAQGFTGRVEMVSRHGLLPRAHAAILQATLPSLSEAEVAAIPVSLGSLVRWVRRRLAAAGDAWQSELDRLRPHVAHVYRRLGARDQARFVRHVRRFWDIFRHRATVGALARVTRWERCGRLERSAAHVTVQGADSNGVRVTLHPRYGEATTETYDGVVRCVGPALSLAAALTPLERSLVAGGFVTTTPHGLGFESDADGRLAGEVREAGESRARLWGIGAVLRASSWESTAVPEISRQARAIAQAVVTGQGPQATVIDFAMESHAALRSGRLSPHAENERAPHWVLSAEALSMHVL